MKRLVAGLVAWLDDRTGLHDLRRFVLDEPLPAGTGWWFTLGSVLLLGLSIQVITGIALGLFYAPTPDHAWDSVRFITTSVHGGSFLRGLHHWGATIVVAAAVAHLIRVVLFASYRKPREMNWLIGLALLGVIFAFGLTGYLLPWDQRAYWATVVTINISKLTPFAGELIAGLLRGGEDVGALTLTRWYTIHVMVLPAILVALVGAHLYLLRRHGISGPVRVRPGVPEMFYPHQAARDLLVAGGVGLVLVVLAFIGAPALESPADPTSSDYLPRPDWYYLWLFQLLKYFPGKLEVIGALVVPGLVALFLAVMPWIDRGRSREWRSRRVVLGAFTIGLAGVVTLNTLGALDRPKSRREWNVRELAGATLITAGDRCTRCHRADGVTTPLEPGHITRAPDWLAMHVADPEVLAPGLREPPATSQSETEAIVAALNRMRTGTPPVLDASHRQVVTIVNRSCLGCHTIDGVGGTQGPNLSHVGQKYDAALIARRINDPADVKPDAEMPAFGGRLTQEEIAAVAAWLGTRK